MTVTSLMRSWLGFAVLLIICFAVAGVGASATTPNIHQWYASLSKPVWTPPNWLFGPVWSILYLSMALAAWLVCRKDSSNSLIKPMAAFAVQLVLNAAWSWIFFGLHNPGLAFIEILFLWAAIVIVIVIFWGRLALAGILLLPYLAWVSFAGVLNYAIWRMNS
jgi:translocator protein